MNISVARTTTGKRDINQDSFVCQNDIGLWTVSDGIGGLHGGEMASAISSYNLAQMIAAGEGVNQAIESTHHRIREYSESEQNGANMGATLVLLLSKGATYNVFWAGDCRAYLFNKDLKVLTQDHTLLQFLLDTGQITEEEAENDGRKHGITKALGIQGLKSVRADSVSDRWQEGDKILLCSDGLSGYVPDHEIEKVLASDMEDEARADRLIELALEYGSGDNITVVLVSAAAHIVDDDNDDTEIPDKSILEQLPENAP